MTGCRCRRCASIHAEFISHFGRWPDMTHEDSLALEQTRLDNLASWDRAMRR